MEKTLSSQQATDWREGRRLRAWELKQEGWKQRDIARALGVSKGAVSQWMKRANQEGLEAFTQRDDERLQHDCRVSWKMRLISFSERTLAYPTSQVGYVPRANPRRDECPA